ncbi:NAD-dependent epimerase/dehydratase family protein [Streptomyces sp. SP18BB07]|uniref:NAD-dependent epimerase/dehydratase family protein n=1 Tax=Streptomyces sp. SP18BB07 TaxID=3002522 RepID=UPI002E794652|nr:NAD(P)-dependent oxidoreductase [Streptomyces sp. SP18BB07]MEE1758771.1 NAD(P)-dependent oxidoreductase [Streptomyces sp. SP18BB07]
MPQPTVLITGGAGFVGGHVVRRLLASGGTARGGTVRLLLHDRGVTVPDGAPTETVHGDLCDPDSLRGLCDGVDTLVHLAAQVGGDMERCLAVNVGGTEALLAEATRAGVRRIIQLGTAAVYGDGPHRGEAESVLPTAPVSPTSVTRLAAEKSVLAAGGLVLRPHLVYGEGDTWVIPSLVALLRRVPHWVNAGRARTSVIAVEDLAAAVAALVRSRAPLPSGRVLHANQPEPVRVRDLITTVTQALDLPLPRGEISTHRALELLDALGDPAGARRLSLLAVDHWYDGSALWRLTGTDPGPGFAARFAHHAPWYRAALAAAASTTKTRPAS